MKESTTVLESATSSPPRGSRTLWLTGAGLSLIAVSYGLARFAYGLFMPVFRTEFDLDAATAGAIAAGSYVSYSVAIVLSTVLTPRFGARRAAIAAGIIATAGILMIAAAPSTFVLATGVLIAGSSTGVASPPLAHAVAHTVGPSVRDRTQTVINAGTGVGVAVAGPIALLTLEQWRSAWLVFAVVSAVVTLWVARAVPSGPVSRASHGAATLLPRPILAVGSGRLIAAAALMGLASSAVWTFGRDVLVSTGGMSEGASTTAWILLGAFGVLGAVAGDLTGRVGIRSAWVVAMLTLGAATGMLAAYPGVVPLAWAAAAAFGAAYIGLTGVLLIWGTSVYAQAPAAGVGIAFLAIALGQAAGSPVIGALSEITSPTSAFTVAALTALLGVAIRPRW